MSRSETEIQVQKLKESIQTGKMTTEEFKDRLRQIIDTELLKDDEEVDIDLIKACESYFTHLHGKEEPLSEEERQQQWVKIQDRIKTQGTKKRTFRKAPVYAAIAVAAVIILFFGISIRFQWFLPSSTPDGQQYVITGKQISIETISKAIASHDAVGRFDTDQEDKLQEYLGFSIAEIIPALEEWKAENYRVSISSGAIFLKVRFRNLNDPEYYINYTIDWIIDATDLKYYIEQNKKGEYLKIGGEDVYRSENYDVVTYVWFKGSTIISLFGISADSVIEDFLEVSHEI